MSGQENKYLITNGKISQTMKQTLIRRDKLKYKGLYSLTVKADYALANKDI